MDSMSNKTDNTSLGAIADLRYLRNLADMLDLYVGVGTRKQILEGNERLTLATDDHSWAVYFSQVMSRLNTTIVDEEKKMKIFGKRENFPPTIQHT